MDKKLVLPASLPAEVQNILKQATAVREKAYCPYSKFKVGSAILTSTGKVFTGCNVENASSGLTICAERSAICKAVSEGEREFTHVAVCAESSQTDHYVSPCGACRQVLIEFTLKYDVPVYLTSPTHDKILVTSSRQLLPLGFSQIDL